MTLLTELWKEFCAEISDLPWRDDDADEELATMERALGEGSVLLADEDGVVVIGKAGEHVASLEFVYVRPQARGRGLARDLVRAAASQLREAGIDHVELNVLESNRDARGLYERLGFTTVERILAAPVEQLLAEPEGGPTFGRVHVQTDDADAVARSIEKVLPRLGRPGEHGVSGVQNGWVSVQSELTDREPEKLRALAKELSYLSGVTLALAVEDGALVRYALFDRGSLVDEYASVPELRGPLPPGDVVALGANPTVVARLTGADPAQVRAVARSAASPADLPPALDLYAQIAELMGVEV